MSSSNTLNTSATPRAKSPMGNVIAKRGNRTGFTTGACSAACARAGVVGLISGKVPEQILCKLPNKQEVSFNIYSSEIIKGAICDDITVKVVIVKDAGDDPDATHGAHITAQAQLLREAENIGKVLIIGGNGVGIVTKEGLGLPVGISAINPVPRANIEENVRIVAHELLLKYGVKIIISVPGGEEMAKKTLNARLGIINGISILGTTGIVRPYSTSAFRASVVQAVDVAINQKQNEIVFTTGGRTEKFAMQELPHLDEVCFVQMGDFIQTAFKSAIKNKFTKIYVGAMVGKLTKMCQGLPTTHAWKSEIDRQLLADVANEVGAPQELVAEITKCETARFAAEKLNDIGLGLAFHKLLAQKAFSSIKNIYPGEYQLTILVSDFDGKLICKVGER